MATQALPLPAVHGDPLVRPLPFWAQDAESLAAQLVSSTQGLSSGEAAARLARCGPNELREHRVLSRLEVLWAQVKSPLLLLLVFAAVVSTATGAWVDATIVLVIVLSSVAIGYSREYRAQTAVAALRKRVRLHAATLRDGQRRDVPLAELVPGDVVLLAAGSLVPADGRLLDAKDCFVSEAALTGESFPVEKQPGVLRRDAPLATRTNAAFLGTNVRSGTATLLVVHTGKETEFGAIAHRLLQRPPETDFDRGLRRFGQMLTVAMLVMVLVVFGVHVVQGRPPVETLLFSIALAVGLSPELLPAILSVSLARGAESMSRQGVLVRRLNAIENLGSIDVLCTDKTGTLTEGVVQLDGAFDARGARSEKVLDLASLNAALETGLPSPLDDAVLAAFTPDLSAVKKRAEVPFDFVRKRVSVVLERGGEVLLVTKGAAWQVLAVCVQLADGTPLAKTLRGQVEMQVSQWNAQGLRVLAIATRVLNDSATESREDEVGLTLEGFVTFLDRPREGVGEALAGLRRLGVAVKLISGDSELVARHVAGLVGLPAARVLTGRALDELQDEALWREAARTDLFVEVDPNQKERIIRALKKTGHVVGFLGDGVNDAPAMHASDTSISVQTAVDVAREAADFVLLERDLDVIRRGIEEGRRTFANTMKYVLTTTSANLGNMVSMAAASLVLPFLPLLAPQILLNNLLSDVPAVGIAGDGVDEELIAKPRRWQPRFIGRFMVTFGAVSSAFDLLTFAALLWVFNAGPEVFRTGWFVESLLSELAIAFVVRTRRPFFKSRPGKVLLWTSVVLVPVTLAIPYLPWAHLLGFVPVSFGLLAAVVAVIAVYVVAAEALKRGVFRSEA